MIKKEMFGKNSYGEDVERFTLTHANGLRVCLMNHGATVLSLEAPDRNGAMADIVLGFETAEEYGSRTPYFGCTVGRFANRIAHGKFSLDGTDYQLALNNDGVHSLHGGDRGFDQRIWTAKVLKGENAVQMSYSSPDGEENYPGNLEVTLTYTLTENNELKLDYTATTDQPTPVNLTNHSYFNLAGHDSGGHGEQILMINADRFVPTDGASIPLGELRHVENTPMDFRSPVAIGQRINDNYDQLQLGSNPGYDHNYCINQNVEGERTFTARAEDPASGRVMEVYTTEPGVQLYTSNFLDGTDRGKSRCLYAHRAAFCLETQRYPNSPNRPEFPDAILRPGELFESQTIYKFSTAGKK